MIKQKEIILRARKRGYHLVTDEIISQLPELPECGLLHLFIKHTSAALTINENADPDVRYDMENIFNRIIPDGAAYYAHRLEGKDDMPAHAKSSMIGASITIPITNRHLNMGIWQGIYLCEFRDTPSARHIVATITGE